MSQFRDQAPRRLRHELNSEVAALSAWRMLETILNEHGADGVTQKFPFPYPAPYYTD